MNTLKDTRLLLNVSQSYLADLLHTNIRTLRRWETDTGAPEIIKAYLSCLLDKAFNLTPAYLLKRVANNVAVVCEFYKRAYPLEHIYIVRASDGYQLKMIDFAVFDTAQDLDLHFEHLWHATEYLAQCEYQWINPNDCVIQAARYRFCSRKGMIKIEAPYG